MTTNQNTNTNANQITTPTYVAIWDGNPITKLEIWRKQILVSGGCIIEQGYSLAQAILGTHPTGANYAGPAPNAATQQQAQVRNGRAVAFILTKIEVNSDAYIHYSDPMFLDDPELLWADMFPSSYSSNVSKCWRSSPVCKPVKSCNAFTQVPSAFHPQGCSWIDSCTARRKRARS